MGEKKDFVLGIMYDISGKEACPRLSNNVLLPFSLERAPDPFGCPDSLHGKNPFRSFPCRNCSQHERSFERDERQGSYNEFKCRTYGGKVTEVGIPDHKGTSQENFSNSSLG